MAQRYEIAAQGLSGIPYRIEINNRTYSGTTVTSLAADQQFIQFEGGQRDRLGIKPIWGKEVRINVRTNKDLSPLFGLEDRDAEVRVFRTDTSTLVWKGYVLTDFFQDEPLTELPGIELRAVDGLTTLEGDPFDAISGVSDSQIGDDSAFISYTDLLTGVLSTLYDSPLDVETVVEWYPDASGALTSSDNPLRYSGPRPDLYYDSENGNWLSQLKALRDACKSQGLEIRQGLVDGALTWLVAQPTALSTSSVTSWRYDPTGTEVGTAVSRDFSLSIDSDDKSRPVREFERRTGEFAITHDHAPLGSVVKNPGFERNQNDWTFKSGTNFDTSTLTHDTSSLSTEDKRQQDERLARIDQTSFPASDLVVSAIEQDLGRFPGLPPRTNARVSVQSAANATRDTERVELQVGSYYLAEFNTGIASSNTVENGEGIVPVSGTDRRIPKGATLPVYDSAQGSLSETKATITLTQPAPAGASELVGEISRQLDPSWTIVYYGLTSVSDEVFPFRHRISNPAGYGRAEFLFALDDANGNVVDGLVSLRLNALIRSSNVQTRSVFDDTSVAFEVGGSVIDQSTVQASVSANGQERDVTTLLSSGPSTKSPSRVKGVAPGGMSYVADQWGIGAGGGSLSLAGLSARERLRYFRQHLEKQQLTVFARGGTPVIDGTEVIEWDGRAWRISDFSSDPAAGEIDLVLTEHRDEGTSGITIETIRDTEEGGGTAAGAPSTGTGTGGSTSAVSSVQTRTGDVEFASQDVGSGLKVDTSPSPHQAVIEPADFAGTGLEDDGADALRVASSGIGDGLTGGSGSDVAVDSTVARTDRDESFSGVITAPRFQLEPGGDRRIIYDDNKNGEKLFFQRDLSSSETAITISGVQVGFGGITSPSYDLDVGGTINASGDGYFSGSVGIGTTSTSYDLEVSGEIGRAYDEGRFGSGYLLEEDDGTGQSYFEVDNVRVRGTLRTHIFKKDIIRATNALLYVSDASPLTEDVTTPSSTGNTFTLYVRTPVFDNGDEVSFKDDISGSILQVIATISSSSTQTTRGGQTVYSYSATLDSGTSITIPGGSVMVRTSGARMLLNAADSNAPRQVLRNSNGNVRAVLGNQNGDYGFTSDTFGLSAGDPSGEHVTIEPSSGFRIRDGSTTLAQLSGTALTLGTTGQIKLDPTATIEAKIEGTLEMNLGGEIRNANGDFSIDSSGFNVRQGDNSFSPEYSYAFGANDGARLFQVSSGNIRFENENGNFRWSDGTGSNIAFNVEDNLIQLFGKVSSHPTAPGGSGITLYVLETSNSLDLYMAKADDSSKRDLLGQVST